MNVGGLTESSLLSSVYQTLISWLPQFLLQERSVQGRCSILFYHFLVCKEVYWASHSQAEVILKHFHHKVPRVFLTSWSGLCTLMEEPQIRTQQNQTKFLRCPLQRLKVNCATNAILFEFTVGQQCFPSATFTLKCRCRNMPGLGNAPCWLAKNSASVTDRGTADLKVPLKEIFYLRPSGFIPSVTLPAPSPGSSAEWNVLLPVFFLWSWHKLRRVGKT